jgi:BarA-like signal transduction histidine kinase
VYSKWGFYLTGKKSKNHGWNRVRTVLQEIKIGDFIIVALPGHCIGRLGQITGKAISECIKC